MLRRNSSRNKQRRPLSRSKSTSSITRNPVHDLESIDPAVAERDAQLAALLSYKRAGGRISVEMAPMPRDPASFASDTSDAAVNELRRSLRRSDSIISRQSGPTNVPGIKRRQSIRFAGPTAPPRRTLASRASDNRPRSGTPTSRHPVLRNAENRPASTLSYVSKDTDLLTRQYLDSLRAPAYCLPEDESISESSIYRNLRRSRSMVTTSDLSNPDYSFDNGSPKSRHSRSIDFRYAPLNKENKPLGEQAPAAPSLRAPKSMSFLRSRNGRTSSRSTSRAENDLAIQLARDKFLAQAQQQPTLKSQPSMFFRSKHKRGDSAAGFRKSLRNSSNNSTVLSSMQSRDSLAVPKQGSLRKTARKVSNSLKSKLKGLFTKQKSPDISEYQAPECASRQDSDDDSCLHLEDPPSPEEASMFRVPSHVPSLHDVPSNQQLRSRKGSVKSAQSLDDHQDADDKSRVTSWTNSVTNTISSQETSGD